MCNKTTLTSLIDNSLIKASQFDYDSDEMEAELNKTWEFAQSYKKLIGEEYVSCHDLVNRYDLEITYYSQPRLEC